MKEDFSKTRSKEKERWKEIYQEKKETGEISEFLKDEEKEIREAMKQEIEKLKVEPEFEEEIPKIAQKIKEFDEEAKLKKLFDLAQEKGLAFAVNVAKKMDDPYTLDLFHDILARDEFYKNFI